MGIDELDNIFSGKNTLKPNPEYTGKRDKVHPKYINKTPEDYASSWTDRPANQIAENSVDLTHLLDNADRYASVGLTVNKCQEDYEREYARLQSNWDKAYNSLARAIVSELGAGTIKGFSDIADFIMQKTIEDDNNDYTNPVSQYIEQWKEEYDQNHYIGVDPDSNTAASGGLTNLGWWLDNAPSIVSSLTLLIPSKMLVGGASKLFSALNLGNKVGKGVRTLARVKQTIDKGEKLNGFQKFLISSNTAGVAKDLMKIGATAGLSRIAENYQEARQTYTQMYNEAFNALNSLDEDEYQAWLQKHQVSLKDVDKKDRDSVAKSIATKAADETFKDDTFNILFDIPQVWALRNFKFMNIARPGSMGIEAANRRLMRLFGKSPDEIKKILSSRTFSRKAYDKIRDFAIGSGKVTLAELSEGVEEAVNYIAQQEGLHLGRYMLGDALQDKEKYSTFSMRFVEDYINNPQLWDSAFWGVMGGVTFQGLGSAFNRLENKLSHRDKNLNLIPNWIYDGGTAEEKVRINRIENRVDSFNKYSDKYKKITDGIDIERSEIEGREVRFEEEVNNSENKEAEIAQLKEEAYAKLMAHYANKIAMDEAHVGNFEYLMDFMKNKNVKEGMQTLFNITDKEEADRFVSEMTNIMEQTKTKYYEELDKLENISYYVDLNKLIKDYNITNPELIKQIKESKIPTEYLQLIANANVETQTTIETTDKLIKKLVDQFNKITKNGVSIEDSEVQQTKHYIALSYLMSAYKYRGDLLDKLKGKKDKTLSDILSIKETEQQLESIKNQIKQTVDGDSNLLYNSIFSMNDKTRKNTLTSLDDIINNYEKDLNTNPEEAENNFISNFNTSDAVELIKSLGINDEYLKGVLKNTSDKNKLDSNKFTKWYTEIVNKQTEKLSKKYNEEFDKKFGKNVYDLVSRITFLEFKNKFNQDRLIDDYNSLTEEVLKLHNTIQGARGIAVNDANSKIMKLYKDHREEIADLIKFKIDGTSQPKSYENPMTAEERKEANEALEILDINNPLNLGLVDALDKMFKAYDELQSRKAQPDVEVKDENEETQTETKQDESKTQTDTKQETVKNPTIPEDKTENKAEDEKPVENVDENESKNPTPVPTQDNTPAPSSTPAPAATLAPTNNYADEYSVNTTDDITISDIVSGRDVAKLLIINPINQLFEGNSPRDKIEKHIDEIFTKAEDGEIIIKDEFIKNIISDDSIITTIKDYAINKGFNESDINKYSDGEYVEEIEKFINDMLLTAYNTIKATESNSSIGEGIFNYIFNDKESTLNSFKVLKDICDTFKVPKLNNKYHISPVLVFKYLMDNYNMTTAKLFYDDIMDIIMTPNTNFISTEKITNKNDIFERVKTFENQLEDLEASKGISTINTDIIFNEIANDHIKADKQQVIDEINKLKINDELEADIEADRLILKHNGIPIGAMIIPNRIDSNASYEGYYDKWVMDLRKNLQNPNTDGTSCLDSNLKNLFIRIFSNGEIQRLLNRHHCFRIDSNYTENEKQLLFNEIFEHIKEEIAKQVTGNENFQAGHYFFGDDKLYFDLKDVPFEDLSQVKDKNNNVYDFTQFFTHTEREDINNKIQALVNGIYKIYAYTAQQVTLDDNQDNTTNKILNNLNNWFDILYNNYITAYSIAAQIRTNENKLYNIKVADITNREINKFSNSVNVKKTSSQDWGISIEELPNTSKAIDKNIPKENIAVGVISENRVNYVMNRQLTSDVNPFQNASDGRSFVVINMNGTHHYVDIFGRKFSDIAKDDKSNSFFKTYLKDLNDVINKLITDDKGNTNFTLNDNKRKYFEQLVSMFNMLSENNHGNKFIKNMIINIDNNIIKLGNKYQIKLNEETNRINFITLTNNNDGKITGTTTTSIEDFKNFINNITFGVSTSEINNDRGRNENTPFVLSYQRVNPSTGEFDNVTTSYPTYKDFVINTNYFKINLNPDANFTIKKDGNSKIKFRYSTSPVEDINETQETPTSVEETQENKNNTLDFSDIIDSVKTITNNHLKNPALKLFLAIYDAHFSTGVLFEQKLYNNSKYLTHNLLDNNSFLEALFSGIKFEYNPNLDNNIELQSNTANNVITYGTKFLELIDKDINDRGNGKGTGRSMRVLIHEALHIKFHSDEHNNYDYYMKQIESVYNEYETYLNTNPSSLDSKTINGLKRFLNKELASARLRNLNTDEKKRIYINKYIGEDAEINDENLNKAINNELYEEFVIESLTNRDLANALNKIKVSEKFNYENKTLLGKIFSFIKKLFNLVSDLDENSLLAKELHYIGEIISNENEDITETETEDTSETPSKPTIEPATKPVKEGVPVSASEPVNLENLGVFDEVAKFADKDIYTDDSAIGENLSTEIETNDISLLVRSLPLAEQAKFTTSLLDGEYKTFCK